MKKIIFFSFALCFCICGEAQSVKWDSPQVMYPSGDFCKLNISQVEFSKVETRVTFCVNEPVDTVSLSKQICLVEDGGIRHKLIGINGLNSDMKFIPAVNGNSFTLVFESCNNKKNQCLDIVSGKNQLYGLHNRMSQVKVPKKEFIMPKNELDHKWFKKDSIEIYGYIPGYVPETPMNIYCQYLHIVPDADRDTRCVPINDDGTFHMKFQADHPGHLSFMIYGINSNYSSGTMIARLIYARPTEKLYLTFDSYDNDSKTCFGVTVKNDSHMPVYNRIINNNLRWTNEQVLNHIYVDKVDLLIGRRMLKDAYTRDLECARYIIWHQDFTDAEARMYLNFLAFLYQQHLVMLYREMLKSEQYKDSVDFSYIKEINPYDESYIISPFISYSCVVDFPPPLNEIRKKVYNEDINLTLAEQELKILEEQNDTINKLNGWKGLTYIMQGIFVHSMSSRARALPEHNMEPLRRIQAKMTHPYFINGAEEAANYQRNQNNIFGGRVTIDGVSYSLNRDAATVIGVSNKNTETVSIPEYLSLPKLFDFHGKETVKSIDSNAFAMCDSIKTVLLPSTIKKIGSNAFKGCHSLEYINIPESVEIIDDFAFSDCVNLKHINIPESVRNIAPTAFSGCMGLPEEDGIIYADNFLVKTTEKNQGFYKIKEGTKWIGYNAFSDNPNLESIELPGSLKVIGSFAFSNCSKLRAVVIPESVTVISDYAFSSCTSLVSVSILGDHTYISDKAFIGSPFNVNNIKK